jgi:hypothetical protein
MTEIYFDELPVSKAPICIFFSQTTYLVLESTSEQLKDTVVNTNINSVTLLVVFRQGGPGS